MSAHLDELKQMHLDALLKQLEAAEALAAFMRNQYEAELARANVHALDPAPLVHGDAQAREHLPLSIEA